VDPKALVLRWCQHTDAIAAITAAKLTAVGRHVSRMEDNTMRHANARARAKAQTLPESFAPMLWSIGALFSAVMLCIAWVS
jgi:hypothetical protein